MNEKGLYHLEIDEEFRQLIRPLQKKEFEQLRKNLLKDGCIDPIITWNGIIIDGHNRYRICMEQSLVLTRRESISFHHLTCPRIDGESKSKQSFRLVISLRSESEIRIMFHGTQ